MTIAGISLLSIFFILLQIHRIKFEHISDEKLTKPFHRLYFSALGLISIASGILFFYDSLTQIQSGTALATDFNGILGGTLVILFGLYLIGVCLLPTTKYLNNFIRHAHNPKNKNT